MKVDKEVLNEVVKKCKDYPCTTVLSGVGIATGLTLIIALGGLGYMIDTKNN